MIADFAKVSHGESALVAPRGLVLRDFKEYKDETIPVFWGMDFDEKINADTIIDLEKTNTMVEKEFRNKWHRNVNTTAKNYPDMTINNGLSEFADTLRHKSVILIGAGPSLKKNVKLLKDTKITTVAMLHALPYLEKMGVTPQYVVHSDAISLDSEFITKSSKDITMLANVIVAPRVLQKWKGGVRFFGGIGASQLGQRINAKIEPDTRIVPMGCSMGAAIYLFDKIFNAENFIFVGNDLAYDKKQNTHCWDGKEQSDHIEAGIKTYEMEEGSTKEKYFTCYQFYLYKRNIENYAQMRQRTTNKRFINSTEGGMLRLWENKPLQQTLQEVANE